MENDDYQKELRKVLYDYDIIRFKTEQLIRNNKMENKEPSLSKDFLNEAEKQFTQQELEIAMKKNALTQLRAYQDLVYGDCMRKERHYTEVLLCVEKMKEAFNIHSFPEGLINTTLNKNTEE